MALQWCKYEGLLKNLKYCSIWLYFGPLVKTLTCCKMGTEIEWLKGHFCFMHWHYEHKSNVIWKLVQASPDQCHSVGPLSKMWWVLFPVRAHTQVAGLILVQEATDEYSFPYPHSPSPPKRGKNPQNISIGQILG